MSAQGAMTRQITVILVLLGLGAAVGIGVGDPLNWRQAEQPAAEAEPVQAAAVPESSETATATPAETEEPTEEETVSEAEPPRLQEVRIEPDGLAVIAGQARPGAELILRADGEEVARATADNSGAFATVAILGSSAGARLLSLVEIDADGAERPSPDEIIIAPIAAEPVESTTEVAEANTSETAQSDDTAVASNADDEPAPQTEEVAQADIEPQVDTESQETVAAENTSVADASDTTASNETKDVAQAETAPEPASPNVTISTSGTDLVAEDTAPQTQNSDAALPKAEDVADAAEDVVTAALEPATQDTASIAPKAQESAPKPEPADQTPTPQATSDQPTPETPKASEEARPEPQVADSELTAPKEEETQQVALLKSNEEGVQVIQPVVPSAEEMRQIALDSISYSDAGEVELAGRAQSNTQEVRVYLNNQPIAELPVDTSGAWRGELPDVDTGVYTLRIDEIADDGAVTSRVETPFKREEPQVLAAASAQTSDNPVKAITVQQGATLWAIARDRYGEGIRYVQVFEANKDLIRDPDLIYPGQVFTLPEN